MNKLELKRLLRALDIVVANVDMNNEILRLAEDIIGLEYDRKTEKDLLDILENVYRNTKENVSADLKWEKNIQKNKEKQEKIRQERQEKNSSLIQQYHKNPDEKIKKSIKNIIQVDFNKKEDDENIDEEIERIRNGLQKIYSLMDELEGIKNTKRTKKVKSGVL